PDHDGPHDDRRELARCALLDEYWEELQRRSKPDSVRWLSDRDLPDLTIAGDLDVLNLLHQFQRSSGSSGDGSQAGTVCASEPFDLGPESRASDSDRPGGRDRDPI